MKIKNIKIFNPSGEIIRNVNFTLEGVNYILGDISKPKDRTKTSNSIGKTLFLKIIDYILGANEDKAIISDSIFGYYFESIIEHNNQDFSIQRTFGSSSTIFVDGKSIKLDEYRKRFLISRNTISKQVILKSKDNIVSERTNPSLEDYDALLDLLNLTEICDLINEIYELQDKMSEINSNKKQLLSILNIEEKKIDAELFLNEKEIISLTEKIDKLTLEIKELNLVKENNIIQEKYFQINNELKILKDKILFDNDEKESLKKYLENTNDFAMSNKDVRDVYEEANFQLKDYVLRTLAEVNEFYESVLIDRVKQIHKKIQQLDLIIQKNKSEEIRLGGELSSLGKILSNNDAYQNAISLLNEYNNKLINEKYKSGRLEQVSLFKKSYSNCEKELSKKFDDLNGINIKYQEKFRDYKNFVYDIVKSIYNEEIKATFDIEVKTYHKTTRPIKFDLSLKGDAGEGVKEVKKNIFDYLIFNFNRLYEIFVHDSSCYNGIDPRQVEGLLKCIDEIAKNTKKQVIMSINKYQISDLKLIDEIKSSSCLTLSENDKLLKFDF